MKTIKTLLLIVAITFSTVLSASTTPENNEPTTMTEEIGKLLKDPSFTIDQDITATVTITFNDANEIVVLSVDSENSEVKSFIKNRLNYTKLSTDLVTNNNTYTVPVRITQED